MIQDDRFPWRSHLTLAEVAELYWLIERDRQRGLGIHKRLDRFNHLAARHHPPIYPPPEPDEAA